VDARHEAGHDGQRRCDCRSQPRPARRKGTPPKPTDDDDACPERLPCLNFAVLGISSRSARLLRRKRRVKIKVVVHDAEEGGFWAEAPAIPGCATQGETIDELLRNLHDAIEGCLAAKGTLDCVVTGI
jgi:predicted RNase H-like HicB family nuclease